jgi:hypothetical protein
MSNHEKLVTTIKEQVDIIASTTDSKNSSSPVHQKSLRAPYIDGKRNVEGNARKRIRLTPIDVTISNTTAEDESLRTDVYDVKKPRPCENVKFDLLELEGASGNVVSVCYSRLNYFTIF